MNSLISHVFLRPYYLFHYHHFSQFVLRFKARVLLPLKYIFFSTFSAKFFTRSCPTRDTLLDKKLFPETLFSKLRQSAKYPSLKFDTGSIDVHALHNQFEYHSHAFLLYSEPPKSHWHDVCKWLRRYPFGLKKGDRCAWHPYVCSKRIQAWLVLWILNPPETPEKEIVIDSLFQTLCWVELNLEKDIGGNHLWENSIALIWGGLFFEGLIGERWLKKGLLELKQCLRTQVLSSGEHFEKAPSYQKELVHGLQFVLPYLEKLDPEESKFISRYCDKMQSYLEEIAHPSGTLPLFNDAWESVMNTKNDSSQQWVGDLFVWREPELFFVFDAGNLGPDHLPAHSHCDLLTFEFSANKSRVFVNSGTFCYQGRERNLYRGSKSHNVLLVNGENLADIWSSFRMGYRGHIVERFSKTDSVGTWVVAAHDGYKHLGYNKIFRAWFFPKNSLFLFSLHFSQGVQKSHLVQEFLHLHPTVLPKIVDNQVEIISNGSTFYLQPIYSSPSLEIQDSVYAPNFETQLPNKTIVLTSNSHAMINRINPLTAWALQLQKEKVRIAFEIEKYELKLKWQVLDQSFESLITLSTP